MQARMQAQRQSTAAKHGGNHMHKRWARERRWKLQSFGRRGEIVRALWLGDDVRQRLLGEPLILLLQPHQAWFRRHFAGPLGTNGGSVAHACQLEDLDGCVWGHRLRQALARRVPPTTAHSFSRRSGRKKIARHCRGFRAGRNWVDIFGLPALEIAALATLMAMRGNPLAAHEVSSDKEG